MAATDTSPATPHDEDGLDDQCPHCGARVRLEPRHGLSGSLCPACHQVVAGPAATPAPAAPRRPRVLSRLDEKPTCPGCNRPRDRELLRCVGCGASWLYRLMAISVEGADARGRLVEYVLRRQTQAMDRKRVEARFQHLPALVLDRLSEAQARRARQEIEAFGIHGGVEPDNEPLAASRRSASPRQLVTLGALAAILLAVGVYRILEVTTPPPASGRPAPRPEAATGPRVAEPPSDVLAGVLGVVGAPATAFFIDPAGWLLGPAAPAIEVSSAGETLPARAGAPARFGIGLYRVERAAPFSLSPGDATRLSPGERLFVADPHAGRLLPEQAVGVDEAVGRRVYLRLRRGLPPHLHGAPVLNGNGLVVAIYDHAATRRHGRPLAIPINLLVEGQGALTSGVVPPRAASAEMAAWLARAAETDRRARPELYAVLDGQLLHTAACSDQTCSGEVGVLAFGEPPETLRAPLTAAFYTLDQDPAAGVLPAFGGWPRVSVEAEWRSLDPAASPLLGSVVRPLRERLLAGELDELTLYAARWQLERPGAAGGQPFRLVLEGAGGRRSSPELVGAAGPLAGPP